MMRTRWMALALAVTVILGLAGEAAALALTFA